MKKNQLLSGLLILALLVVSKGAMATGSAPLEYNYMQKYGITLIDGNSDVPCYGQLNARATMSNSPNEFELLFSPNSISLDASNRKDYAVCRVAFGLKASDTPMSMKITRSTVGAMAVSDLDPKGSAPATQIQVELLTSNDMGLEYPNSVQSKTREQNVYYYWVSTIQKLSAYNNNMVYFSPYLSGYSSSVPGNFVKSELMDQNAGTYFYWPTFPHVVSSFPSPAEPANDGWSRCKNPDGSNFNFTFASVLTLSVQNFAEPSPIKINGVVNNGGMPSGYFNVYPDTSKLPVTQNKIFNKKLGSEVTQSIPAAVTHGKASFISGGGIIYTIQTRPCQ